MIAISFAAVGVPHIFRDKPRLSRLINRLARDHRQSIGSLTFVLLSDDALLEINRRFLGKNYLTDVITFATSDDGGVGGEVLISYHRTRENAQQYSVSHQQEIRRITLHGMLHLLGYDDSTKTLKRAMTEAENHYLGLY